MISCWSSWNNGIQGDCQFCGEDGFVYHNRSLNTQIIMCDKCRDSIERRQYFVMAKTQERPAESGPTK